MKGPSGWQDEKIVAKRADAIAVHTERNTDDIKTLLAENTRLTEQVKRQTDLLDEIHRRVSTVGPVAAQVPRAQD